MSAIRLAEYGSQTAEELTRDDLGFLTSRYRQAVVATVDPVSLLPRLTASSWVGVIVLPSGCEIRITTKVPVANLFYMLAVVNDWQFRSEDVAGYATEATILYVVARYFRDQLLALDGRGLYRAYTDVSDNLAAVRGRIDLPHDLRQNLIERERTACIFSEFTRDIRENQFLRQTAHLLSECGLVDDFAPDFARIDYWWSDVRRTSHSPDMATSFTYHRLNEHYRSVHQLAALLLRWLSPDGSDGDRRFPAFLVNMNDLYEKFIRQSIVDRASGTMRVRKPRRLPLDRASSAHIQPDLLFEHHSRPILVGDCKYKRTGVKTDSDSDLYQMVAYCTALGLETGVLVYPRHLADVNDELVLRGSPIRLLRMTVDLGLPLSELRSETNRLCDDLLGSACVAPPTVELLP
ncbi:MAG TPA: hypothetical protein VGQ42_05260 [Candidatus Dormibacteraeota bacterium]|nr:hypothetical protein [Candidatus Dormibacteraeota bacterium]